MLFNFVTNLYTYQFCMFTYCILYFSDSELKEEKLQNLPSFLEALGFIVEEMDEVHVLLSVFYFPLKFWFGHRFDILTRCLT